MSLPIGRKLLLVLAVILILGVGLIIFVRFFLFSGLNDWPISSKKELIENYNANTRQIQELKHFFNSIVPDSFSVEIEFNGEKNIDFKVRTRADSLEDWQQSVIFQEWSINPYNYRRTSKEPPAGEKELNFGATCELLRWSNSTFQNIKQMLERANCISVKNGEPTNIGFRRSGMGMYFYNLFDNALLNKDEYNDSCQYILLNDTVVLEYAGGAIGAQCFPDAKD